MTKASKESIDEVVSKKENMFKNGRSVTAETKELYKPNKAESF